MDYFTCAEINDGPVSTPNVLYSCMLMEIHVLCCSHADQYKFSRLSCP